MRKENYKSSSSETVNAHVINRTPAVSGRKRQKKLSGSVLGRSSLRKSMDLNISSLEKALIKSEEILPRNHYKMVQKDN